MQPASCPVCGFTHAPDELFVQDGYDDHGHPLFEPTCMLRPAWEAAHSAPQPAGSFAYHATPRYQEARREGLLPLSGSCNHVALAATPGIASAVPNVRQIPEPWKVLRVDTSGLTLFMELGEARYHGVIAPERLSVVEPRPAPDFTGWSDPSYRVNHTDCLVANGRDPSIRRRLLREAWTEAQRRYNWPSDEQYASVIDELRRAG